MKRFVDTNIFIRILTNDDPLKAQQCIAYFAGLRRVDFLVTSSMNIAEVVWLLDSFYGLSKKEIYEKIKELKKTRGLKIIASPDGVLLEKATQLSFKTNTDFIDCYNALLMKKERIKDILTYDSDFKKFAWVNIISP